MKFAEDLPSFLKNSITLRDKHSIVIRSVTPYVHNVNYILKYGSSNSLLFGYKGRPLQDNLVISLYFKGKKWTFFLNISIIVKRMNKNAVSDWTEALCILNCINEV